MQRLVLTITQSNLDYTQYPLDSQNIDLTMYSFGSYATQVSFTNVVIGYQYTDSADENVKTSSIQLNPIWSFDSATGTCGTKKPGTRFNGRTYAIVSMRFTRQSTGVITRLALPMFLLVLLGALAFWARLEDRVNSTVTMLLAISALYIVVIQNIPPIGYLTKFDTFVVTMFALLFSCCILHLFIIRISNEEKTHKWPLRKFYVRLLEFAGRISIIPIMSSVYAYIFLSKNRIQLVIVSVLIGTFALCVFIREFFSTKKALKVTIQEIDEKYSEVLILSNMETILFNLYNYNKFSSNLQHHSRITILRRREEQAVKSGTSIHEGDIIDMTTNPYFVNEEDSNNVDDVSL